MGLAQTVLVLDEDINLRLSIAQILREAGFLVSMACSPCEALRQLASQSFALVFLDIGLMAGSEMALITKIKGLYPWIPILVLSPYVHPGDKCISASDPKIQFLVKPVEPVEFLNAARSIIIGGKTTKLVV